MNEGMGNGGVRRGETHRTDDDAGVAQVEELVHAGEDHGADDTQNPCTNSRRRHGIIVKVGHSGADLWVGRVFLYEYVGGHGLRQRG